MGDNKPKEQGPSPYQKAWLDDPENLVKFWRGIDRAREKARDRDSKRAINPFEAPRKP